jgi:hypothetical protein
MVRNIQQGNPLLAKIDPGEVAKKMLRLGLQLGQLVGLLSGLVWRLVLRLLEQQGLQQAVGLLLR